MSNKAIYQKVQLIIHSICRKVSTSCHSVPYLMNTFIKRCKIYLANYIEIKVFILVSSDLKQASYFPCLWPVSGPGIGSYPLTPSTTVFTVILDNTGGGVSPILLNTVRIISVSTLY